MKLLFNHEETDLLDSECERLLVEGFSPGEKDLRKLLTQGKHYYVKIHPEAENPQEEFLGLYLGYLYMCEGNILHGKARVEESINFLNPVFVYYIFNTVLSEVFLDSEKDAYRSSEIVSFEEISLESFTDRLNLKILRSQLKPEIHKCKAIEWIEI